MQVDNFAINQHYRTSEEAAQAKRNGERGYDHDGPPGKWGMTTKACPECAPCAAKIAEHGWAMPCPECPCEACRESADDMPDWDHRELEERGFERVISFTKKTTML